jgi:hypothetical protein
LPTKRDVNAGMLQIKTEKLQAFPKTTFLYLNFRIEKFCFGIIILSGMPKTDKYKNPKIWQTTRLAASN